VALFADPTFSRFDAIPACDGQTDGRTDRQTHDDSVYRASIASRGKNGKLYTWSNSTVSVSELAALDRVYMQLKH